MAQQKKTTKKAAKKVVAKKVAKKAPAKKAAAKKTTAKKVAAKKAAAPKAATKKKAVEDILDSFDAMIAEESDLLDMGFLDVTPAEKKNSIKKFFSWLKK